MRSKSLLLAVVFLFVCVPAQAGIIDGVPCGENCPPPCTQNCLQAPSEETNAVSITDLVGELIAAIF